jgi:hypothetical protein
MAIVGGFDIDLAASGGQHSERATHNIPSAHTGTKPRSQLPAISTNVRPIALWNEIGSELN